MHDPLATAQLVRARTALDAALATSGDTTEKKADAFVQGALAVMLSKNMAPNLRQHANPLISKAAAETTHGEYGEGAFAALAAAYVESIAEASVLDSIARHARLIPQGIGHVLIAGGATGDLIREGEPKVCRSFNHSIGDAEPRKAVGLIVLTEELLRAGGEPAMRMFRAELERTVTRAANRSIVQSLVDTNTVEIVGTGNALSDLRAGLKASQPSNAYVVGGPTGFVVDLATEPANRGMGIRGGTFIPGIDVVAIDDADAITIIPASLLAVRDHGLTVRSARHATVDMRDTPESPAEQVSLWQTNSVGLLVERMFDLVRGSAEVVRVVSP